MTGKATKTGKELEQRVANAYRQMGAKKVEHDIELAGNQIDVYVELEMADRSLHRIAVEAKDWTSRVGVDIVNSFAHIVDLLRRARLIEEGIIVSATGFSRPARNAAQTYGIRLLELADLDAMVAKATGPTMSLSIPQELTRQVKLVPVAVMGPTMALSISQELIEQLKKGNVVLFCGAGISVSEGGLPSGGQLARELAERIGEPELAKAPFPEVAQAYELKMGHQSLIEYIANRIDDPRYVPLRTHQLIADLPCTKIVTTNWDRLLEKAMDQAVKPFVKVVRDSDMAYADEAKVLLVKLHGSVEQKDSIIITGDDYYDVFARLLGTANLVRSYFTTKTILFLGFGLADDDFKRLYYEVVCRIGVHQRRAYAVQLHPDEWTTKYWEKKNVQIIAADATMFLEALADALGIVAEATEPTPPTAPPIRPPPPLDDERLQRETQDQTTGLGQPGVAPQPEGHQIIEDFSNEILAQYRVYSLCCHKLLDSYEELSKVCDIDALVGEFDAALHKSYVVDKYGLAARFVEQFLEMLIIQYHSNTDAREKLTAIRWAITSDADDWDFGPALIEFRDIGKGLAQDFYREGGRSPNVELIDSKAPALVFSNQCLLSEDPGCRLVKSPRPISILPDGIHLPFDKKFRFCYYLSYPVLFFHEYVSHVYVPEEIESRKFREGWLMYAIVLFMKTRWTELCEKYPLICAQINALKRGRGPRFTRLASRGYDLAEEVNLWIDDDKFLHFTWDLASYLPDIVAEDSDFHSDFLDRIKPYTSSDRGRLLRSAAEISTSALQLYENLKATSDKF